MQIRVSCLIAAVASALLALFVSPAHAEPAMWVVKDADSTIYLLGTFHLTKPSMHWRSDKIETAFKDSSELWLEASGDGDAAMLQGLVTKYGLDPAHPLSSKLSSDDWAKVQSAAKDGGVPISAVDRMRPWLASVSLVVASAMKQGYDPAKGADRLLEASAAAARKTIKSFETPEQQVQMLASVSEETEVAMLIRSLDDLASGTDYVDRVAEAWMAGDIGALEAMSVGRLKDSPELLDAMFVKRNLAWCDQIAAIMKGAGTSFVAVGAGHLVGEQSVPALLAERGFTVTPY